jgi:UPF0755 protein
LSWRAGRRWFLRLLAVAAAGATAWAAYWGGYWRHFLFEAPYQGYLQDAVSFRVAPGTQAARVARDLERAGVIPLARVFLWELDRRELSRRIQAGTYRFDQPMTLDEVIRALVEGRTTAVSVTIPEGWASVRVFDYLESAGLGRSRRYLELWREADRIRDLDPEAGNLEGYLYPDTYRFAADAGESAVIDAMLTRFRNKAAPVLAGPAGNDGLSRRQRLVLASLVEKETGAASERGLVASVLTNRLRRGMPLQCDPTVIYAEWLEKGEWDGEINVSDLHRDSPYNTYIRRGLPPGPICNPGLAAIRAAMDPEPSDYLYFVSANDGRHIFSSDLEQHNDAVRKYQRDR